ncbi:MAG: F0F1 ATP synthase subunit A, partial [Dehalococcoidia bacterium]|nr:F0F1 ATP synthase subunit A [Dehalococcoidia bacterium]
MKPKMLLVFLGMVVMALASTQVATPKPDIVLAAETIVPVLGFPVTNTILATWVTMAVLILVAWRSTRRIKDVPSRLQNLVELALEWVLNLCENVAGKNARRFFPLVTTLFLFVLLNNWMGILPGYGTIGLVKAAEHSQGYVFNMTEVGPWKIGLMPRGSEALAENAGSETGAADHPGQIKGVLVSFLRGGNTTLSTTLALA